MNMKWSFWLFAAVVLAVVGCAGAGPPAPPAVHSIPELKYRLIAEFGDVFYCDPDFYPVAREGQEEKSALDQLPAIRADADEFRAVLTQLGFQDRADYTAEEKVLIYREHKKLKYGVEAAPSGDGYMFTLRIGRGQGQRIQGTVAASGQIKVLKREASFNTCPICLPAGALIDTPDGLVPVEEVRTGMAVWTLDGSGRRIAAIVAATAFTPVPDGFRMVRVRLDDGRSVTASPGHPTAGGRAIGDYRTGEVLDGSPVTAVEWVDYSGAATYDLLFSGGTGLYWADGVLLRSTLAGR